MTSTATESSASHHYFDREFNIAAVKLLPGEYYVTSGDMMLTTVLGSCVSACVYDRTAGVGGMNHFMLPEKAGPEGSTDAAAMRYGAYSMTMLFDELLKVGARRERLEAKVFGGGAVLTGMTTLNVGDLNADFVLRYLRTAQVKVIAQDLRGSLPRRINYFPSNGRVTVRKLRRQEDAQLVQLEEQALAQALSGTPMDSNKLGRFEAGIPANDPDRRNRRAP